MMLWLLVLHRWDVRAAIAANPRCPRVLLALSPQAGARQWAVAAAAAANPNAGGRFLDKVVRGGRPQLRLYAAMNPALPVKSADRLLADPDPYVRAVAAGNPAASPQALSALAGPMTEPAWILRRVGENPACPRELSDQVLTWLALGGAGDSDSAFDPVECTGSPGEGGPAWYQRQAAKRDDNGAPYAHPLWRVRAMLLRQSHGVRLSGDQVWALARDPRPEVRVGIAGADRLSWDIRRELAHDGDPRVARTAREFLRRKGASPGRWRRLARMRQSWPAWVLFVGAVLVGIPLTFGGSGPSRSGASGRDEVAVVLPTQTYPLPGGGSLGCGWVSAVNGGALEPGAVVTAGSEAISVKFSAGVVRLSDGAALGTGPQEVAAGQAVYYLLPAGPERVAVQAINQDGMGVPPLTVKACG